MSRTKSIIARTISRLEALLFRGGWPVRLARAMGIRQGVRTVQHTVRLGGGADGMPPLRIAYASDFHAGPTTDADLLRVACADLRAAAPDILLLGGDFVTSSAAEIEWLAPMLGDIPAPFGRFAVLGNHDHWCDTRRIVARLEAAGIRVLVNANVRLSQPYEQVWICGLDDYGAGHPDAQAALHGATGVRVVIMHAPSGLIDLRGERFDLALCGHTHGGQLALPGGIPIVVPEGPLSRRYARGRFSVDGAATLLVSVGVGCVVVPLRIFSDPEIVVCTLHPSAADPLSATTEEPA